MTTTTANGTFFDLHLDMRRSRRLCGATWLAPRSFLLLLMLTVLPGAASAFSAQMLEGVEPATLMPLLLLLEIPLAIWVSGMLGAEDRKSMKASFDRILETDFSVMTADEVLSKLFWGENSVTQFLARIWLAVCAAMMTTIGFGKIEPALRHKLEMPPVMLLCLSFTLFSYVFVRNLCEETFKDQLGHATLTLTFLACIFTGIYHLPF